MAVVRAMLAVVAAVAALMRPRFACLAAAALFVTGANAHASEATLLADRAGFLVGHAQRCGVADARLERSAALVEKLIAAFALDRDDRDAAEARFAKRLVASAFAELLGKPVPSCAVVRSDLALFERHRPPAREARSRPPAQSRKATGSARPLSS